MLFVFILYGRACALSDESNTMNVKHLDEVCFLYNNNKVIINIAFHAIGGFVIVSKILTCNVHCFIDETGTEFCNY